MSPTQNTGEPADVASKVLRRAQVAKMTRALQQRLALANVKIKHGWESLSIDSIEPQINQHLKRKRTSSSENTISDTSSVISNRLYSAGGLASSPPTGQTYSDDVSMGRSEASSGRQKRLKPQSILRQPASSHTRSNIRPAMTGHSWKSDHRLPESSPIYHRKHVNYPSTSAIHISYISEGSTIGDEALSPSELDDCEARLPPQSFRADTSYIRSSPPCTPPPTRRRSGRLSPGTSRNLKTGEEGADLLLYFAASPSPRNPSVRIGMNAPSTPPSKHTPLPSSMMNTPGGIALFGFGPNTPSANFNFADFVNITPSPAQVPWRTPIAAKSPTAAREARRRLNFDSLLPPTESPATVSHGRSSAPQPRGLGMELGGELVS